MTVGDTFGDYTVVRLLGKGGMGEVWHMEDASGRQVAAKILDAGADHESRKRFLREAQLALGVKHPNLVETYDVGEDPETGHCYILMEYVPGGTLADYIKANGALPIEDAVAVVGAIAGVLEFGRQKGIVHRDIKPANIMFDAEGTPKLADFGIARAGNAGTETTTVTQTGAMIGTPAYMSPEQMLDAHNVDTRADIYSLGVVFFEMLTGERPNKDDTIVQLMAKAVKGEPLPDVRTLRPEVSASLAQLLNMMVAPDKDGRISTPGQITSALAIIERGGVFSGGRTTRGTAPAASDLSAHGRSPRVPRTSARGFPKWIIPVLVLAALAGGLVIERRHAASAKAVQRTVVVTNTIEKSVVRMRTVTNVTERVIEVDRKGQEVPKELSDEPSREAMERRVGHILIRSDKGVLQDTVERMAKLIERCLPEYVACFGDPFASGLKNAPFVVQLTFEESRSSGGSYQPGFDQWRIYIGRDGTFVPPESTLSYMLSSSLVFSPEPNWASLVFYAGHLRKASDAPRVGRIVEQGRSVDPKMTDYDWRGNPQRKDVPSVNRGPNYYPLHQWRSFGPLEELRKEHPSLMRDYFARKLARAKTGTLPLKLSADDEVRLFTEVMGRDVRSVFEKYGWPLGGSESKETASEVDARRTILNISPRKCRLAGLDDPLRRDLKTQIDRRVSRWRNGRGCLATGRLAVEGEKRMRDGVATWAWLNDDGTFTAAVYPGRSIVFEKHGYETIEIRVPQAERPLDADNVYDFGAVTMRKLSARDARTIAFDVAVPQNVGQYGVELSIYNHTPVGNDYGTIGRERTSVLAEKRNFRAGESVSFSGCSYAQYRLKVSARGCPVYETTLPAAAEPIGAVRLKTANYAVFSLRPFAGGAWTKKVVPVDAVNALVVKDEPDEWGNSRAQLYLDPYKSDRGVGIHFGFGPVSYDDFGEISSREYDSRTKVSDTPGSRRLGYPCEFLPGHVYRMREKHWKLDLLISFDFYGSPESYRKYAVANGLDETATMADFNAESDGEETRMRFRDPDVTRETQNAFDALFPGWKVSAVQRRNGKNAPWEYGYQAKWRGRRDVVATTPVSMECPCVLTRTVKLSWRNPVLVMEVASQNVDVDFLLKVKLWGKVVMPLTLVCTPEESSYERITVPLSAWRGRQVTLQIEHWANQWFYEHAYWSRLEIVDGTGSETCGPVGIASTEVFPRANLKNKKWMKRTPWAYTTHEPPENWMDADFDDSGWKRTKKALGFDRGADMKVADVWQSERIWIRRKFQWHDTRPVYKAVFDLYYDQDIDIYLNGVKVRNLPGWNVSWMPYAVWTKPFASALRQGENVLAFTLKGDGASYFDCGLTIETRSGD